MKMFSHCVNKTNSEHNLMQQCAHSCNDLPYLLSFDIVFHLLCVLQNTLKFLTLIEKKLPTEKSLTKEVSPLS